MNQIIKFDFSKFYKKGSKQLVDMITTIHYEDIDFWQDQDMIRGLLESGIRRLYIIPLPEPTCH